MPKYDYRCSAGHIYEKREGFDAPSVQTCMECGAEARRVLTAPAIVFKGSGWYVTDSRRNGASSTDSPGKIETAESKSETKADSTSDTKTESKSSSTTTPAAAD